MIYLLLIIVALILLSYMKKEATKNARDFKVWIETHKFHLLIVLAVVGMIFYTEIVLMLLVVWIVYTAYSYLVCNRRVAEWENKPVDEVEYRIIDNQIEKAIGYIVTGDKNDEEYKFESENIPLGRVNAFLNYFERDVLNEEIYYFSAIPSKNENELREYGIEPLVVDPWASNNDAELEYSVKLTLIDEVNDLDCIILAVAHNEFREMKAEQYMQLFREMPNDEKVLVDVKGVVDSTQLLNEGIRLWRL